MAFIELYLNGRVIVPITHEKPRAILGIDLGRLLTGTAYHWHFQANDLQSLSIWGRHPREPGAVLIGYFDMEQGTVNLLR